MLVKGICSKCGVKNDRATELYDLWKKWDEECGKFLVQLEPVDRDCVFEWNIRRQKIAKKFITGFSDTDFSEC